MAINVQSMWFFYVNDLLNILGKNKPVQIVTNFIRAIVYYFAENTIHALQKENAA